MAAAIESLRTAKTQLTFATPDKGGHRANAIKDIDRAIAEVQRGIAYDQKK